MRAIRHESDLGQRTELRRAVEFPCEVVTPYHDEPVVYWATDLSTRGVWFDTKMPLPCGEFVVVCLAPPLWWADRELMLFSQITRILHGQGRSGMGLSFLDMSDHERRALTAWLRGRPPPLPRRRPRQNGLDLEVSLPQPRTIASRLQARLVAS